MKSRFFSCLTMIIVALFNAHLAVSQESNPVIRESAALAILELSRGAMLEKGVGSSSVSLQTLRVRGSITKIRGNSSSEGSFVFEDDMQSSSHDYRREITIDGSTHLITSNHGKPTASDGGKAPKRLPPHSTKYFAVDHVPYLMIEKMLSSVALSVRLFPQTIVDKQTVMQIEVIQPAIEEGDIPLKSYWYFDSATYLPIAYSQILPATNNAETKLLRVTRYSHYQGIGGLLLPFDIQEDIGNRVVARIHATSVEPNISIASQRFVSSEN